MHHDMEGHDWNEGHSDHEGIMAVTQLHRIAEMAEMLLDMIGENDELEGWVQFKISRAYNDMSDMFSYIEYKHHQYHEMSGPELDAEAAFGDLRDRQEMEISEAKKSGRKKKNTLWGNIRARRAAGKPRLKPGQKGYPKTLKIESSEFRELLRTLIQEAKRK